MWSGCCRCRYPLRFRMAFLRAIASASACRFRGRSAPCAAASANGPPLTRCRSRPSSGSNTSPVPVSTSECAGVGDRHHGFQAAQVAVGAPVLGQLDAGPGQLAGIAAPAWLPGARTGSKASAVAPAKPTITEPPPSRRTLRALALSTVLPRVTWPSPAMTTLSPLAHGKDCRAVPLTGFRASANHRLTWRMAARGELRFKTCVIPGPASVKAHHWPTSARNRLLREPRAGDAIPVRPAGLV